MKNRIAFIAEDQSDIEVLTELIPKVTPQKQFTAKRFLGQGCGRIRGKCRQWAENLKLQGCNLLILIHDLDTKDEIKLRRELQTTLKPSPISTYIIVIPVHEIEAWLLSDEKAIEVAMNLKLKVPPIQNPEAIIDPKRKLEELIYLKSGNKKRYVNTIHNRQIAAEIRLEKIRHCESFRPLEYFLSEHMR